MSMMMVTTTNPDRRRWIINYRWWSNYNHWVWIHYMLNDRLLDYDHLWLINHGSINNWWWTIYWSTESNGNSPTEVTGINRKSTE
jgi:hypothetical protein